MVDGESLTAPQDRADPTPQDEYASPLEVHNHVPWCASRRLKRFFDASACNCDARTPAVAAPAAHQERTEPTQSFPHRCSGCGLRWSATEAGSVAAELCGDCWRKVQPILHLAPARAAEWQQLLREELDAHEWNSRLNYCWWCQRDVNGRDGGGKQPHGENCWGVRANALLTARAAEWHPLMKAVRAFLAKYDAVIASDEYKGFMAMGWIHGGDYKGENWTDEIQQVRDALPPCALTGNKEK